MTTEVPTNLSSFKGTIAHDPVFDHEIFGNTFYTSVLKVPRKSGVTDELPLIIPEELIKANGIKEGSIIHVTNGQVRTYNRYVDGRSKLFLFIFIKELQVIPEITEEMAGEDNDVYLEGFICKQPTFRTTPFGREISDLMLAVNRAHDKSDYIPMITWGTSARYIGTLPVGTHLKVKGRLQSRGYEKQLETGIENRVTYEVSAFNIEVVGSEDGDK